MNTMNTTTQLPEYVTTKTGRKVKVPQMWDPKRNRLLHDGKTGVWSVGTLAGSAAAAGYQGYIPDACSSLPSCPGTCDQTCPGCYALRMSRYISTYLLLYVNTLEMRQDPGRFYALVWLQLQRMTPRKRGDKFRLNESGDFETYAQFEAAMTFTRSIPEMRVWTYTKNYEYLDRYDIERNKPENLGLMCSPWEGVCGAYKDLAQFILDDGTDPELANKPHCPAVDRNGHRTKVTCNQCGFCPTAKPGTRRYVYKH